MNENEPPKEKWDPIWYVLIVLLALYWLMCIVQGIAASYAAAW
jgi:hypothetical protein